MTDMHDDVVRRLEDAGRTLMMLPMPPRAMPAEAAGTWPDVLQQFWDLAGVADEGTVEERQEALAAVHNATRLRASRAAVTRLDEVLGWLWLIREARERRCVFGRMLMHPDSDKPIYSWGQIARKMGVHRRTVVRWHVAGVDAIILSLANGKK